MTQEIEIKFIVRPEVITSLREDLNALSNERQSGRKLVNIYYETPDLLLRRHDMGLRVRGVDGRFEMTMKTAGKTLGGLHQRPEYNVPVEHPVPELARFPADMWPAGLDAARLEQAVKPLFRTDFTRETWVVTFEQAHMEIALDNGSVDADARSEPLCELELELLDGDVSALLKFTERYILRDGIRQGGLSKAARGYALAQARAVGEVKAFSAENMPAGATLEQGLVVALESALSHWQYHEDLWARGVADAASEVYLAIKRLQHALALFGAVIPRKASTHLREQLADYEQQLISPAREQSVLWSATANAHKLALTDFMVTCGWRPYLDEAAKKQLQGSLKRFADTQLGRISAELKKTFHAPPSDYPAQLPRLQRAVDMAQILAGVYPPAHSAVWIANWQALEGAVAAQRAADYEKLRKLAIKEAPFWRHSGR